MRSRCLEFLCTSFAKQTFVLRRIAICLALLALLFAEVPSAQTYSVIHNFTNTPDGFLPFAGPTMDHAGNLYGTTARGGFAGSVPCGYGCGTVYRLSRTSNGWTTTILYAFKGQRAERSWS